MAMLTEQSGGSERSEGEGGNQSRGGEGRGKSVRSEGGEDGEGSLVEEP